MDEKTSENRPARINRRHFVGAMGVGGAAAVAIEPANNSAAPNQYEFYNYSPNPPAGLLAPNPQEVGNQYFVAVANNNVTSEATIYLDDFYNNNHNNGINIQDELYTLNSGSAGSTSLTAQVAAAINNAFNNYIICLESTGQLNLNSTPAGNACGMNENCENCDAVITCPPTYQP